MCKFAVYNALGQPLIKSSTLVDKEYPEGYKSFMHSSGIKHVCITMEGTKKADIPESVMSTILETVLNPQNHPLLVHCNQGRVCDACPRASKTTDTSSSTALDAPWQLFARSWAGQLPPSSPSTLPTQSQKSATSI